MKDPGDTKNNNARAVQNPPLVRKTLLAAAVAAALAPDVSQAATFAVTESLDDGTGTIANTLSWAILQANTNDGPDIIELQTNVQVTGVMTRLIDSDLTLTSDATRRTLSGGDAHRPLFIKSGTVIIENLELADGLAQGGSSDAGGSGAGLGGALAMYGGNVTMRDVELVDNAASGGSSGAAVGGSSGGGGLYGNGADCGVCSTNSSGGGGLFAAATDSPGGYGGSGNYGGFGGAAGGINPGEDGGDGGFGGGGGGAGGLQTGGTGGFGGGGGAAFYGGNGGLGGGGGAGGAINGDPFTPDGGIGGDGGFGGGAGSGGYFDGNQYGGAGTPGFGGGSGSSTYNQPGGPGAGFGGAVFVRSGTLRLERVTFTDNTASAASDGLGKGGALFALHVIDADPVNGNTQGMPSTLPSITGCEVAFSGNAADNAGEANGTGDTAENDTADVYIDDDSLPEGLASLAGLCPSIACGDVVDLQNHTVVLDSDLNCLGDDPALTVIGPGKFDMAGHTISCGGDAEIGLLVNGAQAKVLNGVVGGNSCGDCVRVAGAGRHTVEGVVARGCAGDGFQVSSDFNSLKSTTAIANEVGFMVTGSLRNTIRDSHAVGNTNDGFVLGGIGHTVRDSTAIGNGPPARGIAVTGTDHQLLGNTVTNNGEGIGVDATDSRIQKNRALNNDNLDLSDADPDCDTNRWRRNIFGSADRDCIE